MEGYIHDLKHTLEFLLSLSAECEVDGSDGEAGFKLSDKVL